MEYTVDELAIKTKTKKNRNQKQKTEYVQTNQGVS